MRGESEGLSLGDINTLTIVVTEPSLEGAQVAPAHIYLSICQSHGDS